MKILLILTLLLPMTAMAATRSLDLTWDNPTHDVDGELLDSDGDGDLSDGLTGYNVYRVSGNAEPVTRDEMVQGTIEPWDNLTFSTRLNLPWGEHCFVVTAYYNDGAVLEESDNSGIVCKTWKPGRPNPPGNARRF